jgi:hypothetical protein
MMPEDPTATMRDTPGDRTHYSVAVRLGLFLKDHHTITHKHTMPLLLVVRPGIAATTAVIVVLLNLPLGILVQWILLHYVLGLGHTTSSGMAFAPVVTGTGKRQSYAEPNTFERTASTTQALTLVRMLRFRHVKGQDLVLYLQLLFHRLLLPPPPRLFRCTMLVVTIAHATMTHG